MSDHSKFKLQSLESTQAQEKSKIVQFGSTLDIVFLQTKNKQLKRECTRIIGQLNSRLDSVSKYRTSTQKPESPQALADKIVIKHLQQNIRTLIAEKHKILQSQFTTQK